MPTQNVSVRIYNELRTESIRKITYLTHKYDIVWRIMDEIDILLHRGVDTIYPSKAALETVLRSGKKLTLYQGFDPTGSQLHIGHMVALRKLRQFQDLGHRVIFLIGDGTGQAGDPSGKKKSREKFFTREELRQNALDYVNQAGKIVRFNGDNPVEIRYNGDWLNSLTLIDILNLAQHFSVQQLIERDMFQERLKKKETINLREFLYPLLQGYDSVAMNVDLELGGTDQTFNMLAGRTLVKALRNKEKFVMTVPLLTDSKGVKIGKSEGNVIGITDVPNELYAKIMALGDDAISPCFRLLTDISDEELSSIERAIGSGANPMEYKKLLAHCITSVLHTNELADAAQTAFEHTFQERTLNAADIPSRPLTDIPEGASLIDVLSLTGLAKSRSEARRLIQQRAVDINGSVIASDDVIRYETGDIIKIGKKTFLKLI